MMFELFSTQTKWAPCCQKCLISNLMERFFTVLFTYSVLSALDYIYSCGGTFSTSNSLLGDWKDSKFIPSSIGNY